MTFLNRCLAGVITTSTGLDTVLPPTSTPGDAVTLKDQLDALLDASVYDSTGTKIGAVRQVYVDDASGKITFATVSTGIFSSDAIVPLHGARLLGDELHVDHTRSVIRDSPRPDHTEDALTADQEVTLLEHYGIEAPARAAAAAPATPRATPPGTRDEESTTSAPTPPVGEPQNPGELGARGTDAEKADTRKVAAKSAGAKDTVSRDAGPKDAGPKSAVTNDPGAKDAVAKDEVAKGTVTKNAGPTPDSAAAPTDRGGEEPKGGSGPAASPDRG